MVREHVPGDPETRKTCVEHDVAVYVNPVKKDLPEVQEKLKKRPDLLLCDKPRAVGPDADRATERVPCTQLRSSNNVVAPATQERMPANAGAPGFTSWFNLTAVGVL
jgi:hypothetical protein